MNRRQLLRRLGLGMGGLGLGLSGLGSRQLLAQEQEAPRRLLLLSHCHGWPHASWRIRPEGLSEDQPWSLDLNGLDESQWSQPLAPLFAHRLMKQFHPRPRASRDAPVLVHSRAAAAA